MGNVSDSNDGDSGSDYAPAAKSESSENSDFKPGSESEDSEEFDSKNLKSGDERQPGGQLVSGGGRATMTLFVMTPRRTAMTSHRGRGNVAGVNQTQVKATQTMERKRRKE